MPPVTKNKIVERKSKTKLVQAKANSFVPTFADCPLLWKWFRPATYAADIRAALITAKKAAIEAKTPET